MRIRFLCATNAFVLAFCAPRTLLIWWRWWAHLATGVRQPCDMANLLMGAAAMSNLLMSPTRAPSRSRHIGQRRLLKLLIDHVSALEYATECATSEAYNTIFTAHGLVGSAAGPASCYDGGAAA
jgi:hypothetical protein